MTTRAWLFLVLIGLAPGIRDARAEPGRFLLISDIHFDPFADGKLFGPLRDRPVEEWAEVLEASEPAGINPRGTDSNYALLKSSLDDARRRDPSPDFILYPGDLMAHQWQARYDRLAPKSHTADPEAYRAFTAKAIRFLALEFRRRFPEAPILPTLGNEDSYCGDYRVEPGGPFLAMFADAWAPLLGPDRGPFRATFSTGGYYTVPLPRTKKGRLIVLNSVFFSVNYDDACAAGARTPALDQLRWLDEILARAAADGEAVWLLLHVPPGVNAFNSAEAATEGGPPAMFWQPELSGLFLKLVAKYPGAIRAVFAGHTHMDDYRVLRPEGGPAIACKIAPAISPIFGNNPGYQAFNYDRDDMALRNFRAYFKADLTGEWAFEYDFREAYGLEAFSAASIERLAGAIRADSEVGRRYVNYYGVSAPPEITPRTLDVYRCAITHVTAADFLTCLGGVPRPRRPIAFPDRRPASR